MLSWDGRRFPVLCQLAMATAASKGLHSAMQCKGRCLPSSKQEGERRVSRKGSATHGGDPLTLHLAASLSSLYALLPFVTCKWRLCHVPTGIWIRFCLQGFRDVTQDGAGNQVNRDDMVNVVDGPAKGKSGTVRYIMRGMLFLHSRENLDHGGFMCVSARACRIRGGAGSKALSFLAQSAMLKSPAPHRAAMETSSAWWQAGSCCVVCEPCRVVRPLGMTVGWQAIPQR